MSFRPIVTIKPTTEEVMEALDNAELRQLEELTALTDKLFEATAFAGKQLARAETAEFERDSLRQQLDIAHHALGEERVCAVQMLTQDQHESIVAGLRDDLAEARRQLRAEQDAARRVVDRLCKAMGTWQGSWLESAEEQLRAVAAIEGLCGDAEGRHDR